LNMMVSKPGLVKAYVLFAPISFDYRDNFYKWIAPKGKDVMRKYGPPAMREKIEALYGSPESNPVFLEQCFTENFHPERNRAGHYPSGTG